MGQKETEDEEKQADRINAACSHGGLRPRTVSKASRSLQGGCGPPVRHSPGTQPVSSQWKSSEEPAQRRRWAGGSGTRDAAHRAAAPTRATANTNRADQWLRCDSRHTRMRAGD